MPAPANISPATDANIDKKKAGASNMHAKSNAEEEKHNNLRGAAAGRPDDESPSIFSRGGIYFDEHQ